MAPAIKRVIRIEETGIATLERIITVPGPDGPRERVEAKRVDASVLIPDRGALAVLPDQCRLFYTEEGRTVFVIEEPPSVHTVHWITQGDVYRSMKRRLQLSGANNLWGETPEQFQRRLSTQNEFQLAFPYLVKCYLFVNNQFNGVSLWYRTKPITDERAELLRANLPNQEPSSHMLCLTQAVKSMGPRDSVVEAVRFIEQEFWFSGWNQDWTSHFSRVAGMLPEVASPWEWERNTRINPLFILDLQWETTERTVGEEMRRLMARAIDQTSTFAFFERRVQAADPFDSRPRETDSAIQPSPAETIRLSTGTLSVGAVLEFRVALSGGIQIGDRRRIEWFSKSDGVSRWVKVEGAPNPLPLITNNKLIQSVLMVENAVHATVEVEGVAIGPGTLIRFHDRNLWPNRNAVYTTVSRVEVGPRETVMVRFENEDFLTAIAEGGAVFPGFTMYPAEEKDAEGYLRQASITLLDGSVVECGQRYIIGTRNGEFYGEQTIMKIGALATGRNLRIVRTDRASFFIEDEQGRLSKDFVLKPEALPQEVQIGSAKIRVGDYIRQRSDYRPELVTSIAPPIPNGTQFIQLSSGWRLAGIDGRLCEGWVVLPEIECTETEVRIGGEHRFLSGQVFFDRIKRRVRVAQTFFRESVDRSVAVKVRFSDRTVAILFDNWKPNPDLELVETSVEVGGCEPVKSGDRLRLTVPIKNEKAGHRLLVSHIRPAVESAGPLVVATSGAAFELNAVNAQCFEIRRGIEWKPLGDGSIPPPEPKKYRAGDHLEVGVRVQYTGNGEGTDFHRYNGEKDAQETPATIIERSASNGKYLCKFDRPVPGAHNATGRFSENVGQWIVRHNLRRIDQIDVRTTGFTTLFIRSSFAQDRCVNFGKVIGRDRLGREIRSGDRVKAFALSSDRGNERAQVLQRAGHVFRAVHFGNNGRNWLYLDAGVDVGQIPRRADGYAGSVVGLENIPAKLQNDDTWWHSLCWAQDADCELVG
ncbi:MAG: hypothetical protein Q8P82_01290 [bacterium]|nr:hypothetical protein [bacterium]